MSTHVSEPRSQVNHLKHVRTGYVGKLTSFYRVIDFLVESGPDNVDIVSTKLQDLNEAFNRFSRAHYEYYSALEPEDQEGENVYYNDHLQRKLTIELRVKSWIEENEIVPEDSVSNVRIGRRRGSVVSSGTSSLRSATSSTLLRRLKTKDALAQMEMEQLKFKQDLIRQEEEMKLKRQILEAQYKVEKAKLQVEIFEEDEEQQHSIKRDQPPKDHLDYQLEQECTKEPQQIHRDKERQDAMMNALSRVVHLPKPDLQTFNGDPLDFWSFTSVFDNYIERNASSDSERLIYLLQYTSGDAKRVIKGCSMMNPAKGYQTARKLLKELFGHPYVIAAKCVNKLTDGPAIKPSDRVGLLNFADELTECQNLLESIGYLEEINSADNLRRIVQRLPFNLKSRFIDLADTLQQSGKRTNISHIAEFVKTKARAANNPVFGTIVDAYPETRRSKPNAKPEAQHHGQHRVTSLNTSVSREQNNSHSRPSYSDVQTCPACKGSHQLKGCHKFTNMSFEDRFKIMRSCNLCNNCFKQGHIALGCLEKKSCEVEGCTRRHHTLLHHPNSSTPVNDSSSKETIPTVAQAHNISNVQPSESSERICLRIVPVKVKGPTKSVITYALLDNGSDVSLCEKDLAAQIGVRGEEKSYYLTTQEKKNSRKVGQYLTGLTVESLDDGNRLNIPKLWTVDNLNVASHSIPSNADVKRWPHLYDVNLLDIEDKNSEVDYRK